MSNTSKILSVLLPLGLAAVACDSQVDPAEYEGEPLATLRGYVNTHGASAPADVGILWHLAQEDDACHGPTLSCSSYGWGGTNPDRTCTDACEAQFTECNGETAPQMQACHAACGEDFVYNLSWRTCGRAGIGARAPVEGDFPASFSLDLLDAPPADTLMTDHDGVQGAVGFIVGLHPNATDLQISFDADEIPQIVGGVQEYALLYAPAPIPAASGWGEYLGSAYAAGFHLIQFVDAGTVCLNQDCSAFSTGEFNRVPAPQGLGTELVLDMGEFHEIVWPSL